MSAAVTDVVLFDPAAIELATDPREGVLQCCEQGKAWLAYAVEHRLIEQIVQLRSQAGLLEALARQMHLGKEAARAATELVRQAERAIGVAIRTGQEAGDIETIEEAKSRGGKTSQHGCDTTVSKPKPTDYAAHHELSGPGIYAMTDGVSDERFEAAIGEAKVEGNLSRANVVRKIKGTTPARASVARPEILRNTHHLQPTKVIGRTVVGLEGFCMGVALLEPEHYEGLDQNDVEEWSSSLRKSLRSLNQFAKELNHVRV